MTFKIYTCVLPVCMCVLVFRFSSAFAMNGTPPVFKPQAATSPTYTFADTQLQRLVFDSQDSHVVVLPSPNHITSVTQENINFAKACKVNITHDINTIHVTSYKPFSGFAKACQATFTIYVPAAVRLDLTSVSGNITVTNALNPVYFSTTSGNVRVNGPVSVVEGQNQTGNTAVSDLMGDAKLSSTNGDILVSYSKAIEDNYVAIKTRSGHITLAYAKAPLDQTVDLHTTHGDISVVYASVPLNGVMSLKTDTGNATISLPTNTHADLRFTSGTGKLRSEFENWPQAAFHLSMESSSGNMHIVPF